MNRLEEFFREPPEPERADDFYEIESFCNTFAVSRGTALEIQRQLDQVPSPRWVAFTDLVGASHRVLVRLIYRISESTAAQRAAEREFHRARRLEEKKDRRPWEDAD